MASKSLVFYVIVLHLIFPETYSAIPGEPCNPVDPLLQCSDPNSICDGPDGQKTCTCVTNYFPSNGACVRFPVIPGQPCDVQLAPCVSIPNTHCDPTNLTCDCLPNFSHDTVNRRCIPSPSKPGDICQEVDVPCAFDTPPTTECGPVRPPEIDPICECLDGKVTDIANGVCLTMPTSPGDSCTIALTPCTDVENTTCSPDGVGGMICNCNDGFVLQPVDKVCLAAPRQPGDSCDPIYNLCSSIRNTNCKINGTTANHVCICNAPFVTDFFARECLSYPSLPGDPCHREHTPCLNVNLTTCDSDPGSSVTFCKCVEGYVTLPSERVCLSLPSQPGDSCRPIEAPCSTVNNTICESNNCRCVGELITDEEYGRCLRTPVLGGDPCHPSLAPCFFVSHATCQFDSTEDEFLCSCEPGYVLNPGNGSCLAIPTRPGDICDPTLPLPCTGVVNATTCSCNGPYCYCKCDGDLINDPELRRCISTPSIPYQDCHPTLAPCHGVPDTICSRTQDGAPGFKCVCVSGFVHDPLSQRCVPQPLVPGDSCEPNLAPCTTVANTTCEWVPGSGHICRCISDLVTEGRSCYSKPTHPGDRCSSSLAPCTLVQNTTCATDTILQYPYCRCVEGFFTNFVSRACVSLPTKPGDLCDPGAGNCNAIPNASCRNFSCVCDTGFEPNPEETECIQLPDQEKECVDSDTCINKLGPLSYCHLDTNTCHCFQNATLIQGQCRYPSNVGEDCVLTEECIAGGGNLTWCDSSIGKCACVPGYTPNPGNTCRRTGGIGNNCTSDEDCQPFIVGYAICHAQLKICTCIFGNALSDYECSSQIANLDSNVVLALGLILIATFFSNNIVQI